MALKLANNAVSRLAANLSAVATVLSITPGEGARFPVLAAGDTFPCTITKADGTLEIVTVTARTVDTFTIVRAQEATVAFAFLAGDRVELRLTAKTILTLQEVAIHAAASKAVPVDADEFSLADSAAAFILKKLTWANIKATLWTSLGTLIATGVEKVTPVDADTFALSDSAAANATKKMTFANIKAVIKTFVLTGGQLSGLLIFKAGAAIASAANVNLSTATGNTVHITGTTAISAWTMVAGQVMDVIFDGVLVLVHNATTNNLIGQANILTVAGDRARVYFDGTTTYVMNFVRTAEPSSMPPGAIVGFAKSTPEPGWLKANGAAVSRVAYAALFAKIGGTFGAGDGSTTFNLPDVRGEFVRFWDDSRGLDPGRGFASVQGDEYRSHSHTAYVMTTANAGDNNNAAYFGISGESDGAKARTNPTASDGQPLFSAAGGAETRPRNMALLGCIKY